MEVVVHEAAVPPHGDALPGRAEVGFRSDRVLVIAELVPGIGNGFDQRHLHIGRVSFGPIWHQGRQAVEHELAEAGVILGQVIDIRGRHVLGWADVFNLAVEVARAVDLESESDRRKLRIEPGGRIAILFVRDQTQDVVGVIPRAVDLQCGDIVEHIDFLDGDIGYAHTS